MTDLSRAVSHALRHEPWLYELELDDEGWTPVDALIFALKKEKPEWSSLTPGDLCRMVATSSKRRHEILGGMIRALYGHSTAGKLKKGMAVPPDVLFHGTAPDVVPNIRSVGLLPMGRQYVHLSADQDTAFEVGKRKARTPVILRISAKLAHDRGVHFYEGNEKVWLADSVPPEFVEF